ncbi:hypothetical protein HHL19_00585 [Streptomyces sp. R302]|uniref:hypothetical protein n=1 Tax=unclassified Streptomyces TaxID=2593676 RepID=UPI00145D73AA|nr:MULTISPECIES: hypothetical protein [unclassified Streptomyces]NML48869.1 hypothetical protein [Streptomyces sp. R301]NML77196.1 hypothetical protein [Streptomyces sp. R302]
MASAPRPLRSARARARALAAAAAALTGTLLPASASAASAASAAPAPPPVCGADSDSGFPLETRIQDDGSADYPAGGAFRSWELEVRNTTGRACTQVHPVLVLADEKRVLRPEQIRLEFYDAEGARWRPVAFEATEEAESVGAFTGADGAEGTDGTDETDETVGTDGTDGTRTPAASRDFDGFAVPARRTVTVPVRLAFRADAVPDEVVVNAALVQRRGADGDWVGRSDDYRLTIGPPAPAEPSPSASAAPTPVPDRSPLPPPSVADPAAPTSPSLSPSRPELARTGREEVVPLAPWAAALALAGALLVRAGRRLRGR